MQRIIILWRWRRLIDGSALDVKYITISGRWQKNSSSCIEIVVIPKQNYGSPRKNPKNPNKSKRHAEHNLPPSVLTLKLGTWDFGNKTS